jgi:hypothetical protein
MFLSGDIGAVLLYVLIVSIVFAVLFLLFLKLCFKKLELFWKVLLTILFLCFCYYLILNNFEFFVKIF